MKGQVALRPAAQVMRLARMGTMFPTRLSFLRVLIRNLTAAQAHVSRPLWDIDSDGFGDAVYTVHLPEGDVSLCAFSRALDDRDRSDRVIATAWDAAFVLYDGVPDEAERARLSGTAPLQEAGRFTDRDLVLSRANKSVRLFNAVVEALRAGRQPDPAAIAATGYLMRTTAVYGNGKFGIADHTRIARRPILGGAFMAEMLTVWLIRGFTHDLAEHLGQGSLDRSLKRHLGVGNATGLGMAPYLVSHPHLVDVWFSTREAALARVRGLPDAAVDWPRLAALADRVRHHLDEWRVTEQSAMQAIDALRKHWRTAQQVVAQCPPGGVEALLALADGPATEELLVAFVIEAHGTAVDDLAPAMATAPAMRLDPGMSVYDLRAALATDWAWATAPDYADKAASARFWYVSEDKLEPRIGDRYGEPGADRETPLDIARRVASLARDLEGWAGGLAAFLLAHPCHRAAVARVQGLMCAPYCEIRDNLIGADCRPIDMLRAKLAMFGATKFDPKSDLWTRITLAQGAPLPDELDGPAADDWWLAALRR